MNSFLLTNARVFTGENDAPLTDYAVWVEGPRIRAVAPLGELPAHLPSHDLRGLNLAPGFIDLQLNGGGGRFFTQHPDATSLRAMYEANLRHGTTHMLPTLVSSPFDKVSRAIATVREAMQAGQYGTLGLHLEGPYFHPQRRGAHKAEYVRAPTDAELQTIVETGNGVVKILTLAPELLTDRQWEILQARDFVLAAGHSDATYAQATDFFARGVGLVTHLYNAMSPFQHRAPGLAGATLDAGHVDTTIIMDGHHCHYAAVRLAARALGQHLLLITDAVDSADADNSSYGDFVTQYNREGDRFVTQDGTLAGSCITMRDAAANCVRHAGIPLAEALRMASTYPARALGLADRLGYLKPGYQAAMVAFNDDFRVSVVVADGVLCEDVAG